MDEMHQMRNVIKNGTTADRANKSQSKFLIRLQKWIKKKKNRQTNQPTKKEDIYGYGTTWNFYHFS